MNINRLRPTGVKSENLDVWLSSVIHDAIRDAREAGMPQREIATLLGIIAKSESDKGGVRYGQGSG